MILILGMFSLYAILLFFNSSKNKNYGLLLCASFRILFAVAECS
jgi:hypothetical protein